jgi:two-component system, sensor histidine kinase ChiS
VDVFSVFAKKKNIYVLHQIDAAVIIQADPMAINRIINNLFDNAIKYSPENTKITVTLNSSADKVMFAIKDEGEGIPKHLQQKIFEPYYQITRPKSNAQGMGLGLPIVSKVVADINGEIMVNSNPPAQTGTEIILTLKRYYPQNKEQVASEVFTYSFAKENLTAIIEPVSFQIDKPTIMLVEDNVTMLNYLIKKLQLMYNIITCTNGADAIKKLKNSEQLPSLIISDVMMDKMDGYEMVKIIAQVPECNHIPVIFLTAKNASTDRLQGLQLGAVDYIAKPFHIGELLQKVQSIISNTEKQKKTTVEILLRNAIRLGKSQPDNGVASAFEQNCQRFKLSIREVEISGLIGLGMTYKAIAEKLFLSEKTVNKHAQNIFEKVQVGNKLELMRKLESATP